MIRKFLDAITDICIKENKEFNINDDSEASISWTYEIQSWAGRTDEDQYCLPTNIRRKDLNEIIANKKKYH